MPFRFFFDPFVDSRRFPGDGIRHQLFSVQWDGPVVQALLIASTMISNEGTLVAAPRGELEVMVDGVRIQPSGRQGGAVLRATQIMMFGLIEIGAAQLRSMSSIVLNLQMFDDIGLVYASKTSLSVIW